MNGWRLSAGSWEPEVVGAASRGRGRFTLSWRRTYQTDGRSHNLGSRIGSWDRKRTFVRNLGKSSTFFSEAYGAMLISWLTACTVAKIRGYRNSLLYLQLLFFVRLKLFQNKELLNKRLRITETSVWRKVWNWLLFFQKVQTEKGTFMGTECEGLQKKSSESKENYVLQTKETAMLESYPYRACPWTHPQTKKWCQDSISFWGGWSSWN